MKNDFSILFSGGNPLWGAILEVNNATYGMLGICILAVIWISATYVMIRYNNDSPKSMAYALYITTLVALILYYADKTDGIANSYAVVSDFVFLALIVGTISIIIGLYYTRIKGS